MVVVIVLITALRAIALFQDLSFQRALLNDGGDCGIMSVPFHPFVILSRRAKMIAQEIAKANPRFHAGERGHENRYTETAG